MFEYSPIGMFEYSPIGMYYGTLGVR